MRVIVESPFHGKNKRDRKHNERYLKACLRDSTERGESPFASHGFYPHFLNEDNPIERGMGIACNLDWMKAAELVVLYIDRGVTKGMEIGRDEAMHLNIRYEHRELGKDWEKDYKKKYGK